MWGYEARRRGQAKPGRGRAVGFLGTLLALPVFASEPAPAPQSADPLIAAALRYERGEGVPSNAGRAAEMYCAAARQGNADAAYRLGWMYANGGGIERDDGHAAALFQRAAAQGHELAARMLETARSGDAHLPLCIVVPPPPAADVDSAQLAQARQEETAPKRTGATDAGTRAAAAPAAPAVAGVDDRILLAIARWADAWTLRDVDRYLAAYAPDFQTGAGESRQQWEARRRERIAEKAWIYVGVRNLTIVIEGDQARARFVQEYRSDKGRESSIKTLTLVNSEQTWLIRQEQSDALPPSTTAR